MENAGYTVLTRQTGLIREMQTIANNIANATTTGFKAEGVVFSEYVMPVERGASLSMGQGNVAKTSLEQGSLTQTGGTFDLAIEGDGFFLIETPLGERLTRAGSFSPRRFLSRPVRRGCPLPMMARSAQTGTPLVRSVWCGPMTRSTWCGRMV